MVRVSFYQKTAWQSLLILLAALTAGLIFNHLRANGIPLTADWSPEARMVSASGHSLVIPTEEARQAHAAGQALFLDARSQEWFEMGHIQGARNLPPEEIEGLFAQVLGDVPPDRLIVTYCDGEDCDLSYDLALALMERGFTNVRVLINGWTVWREAGLPVEEGRS